MRTAFIITLVSLLVMIGVSVGIVIRTRADIDPSKKTEKDCEDWKNKKQSPGNSCNLWIGSTCFKGGKIISIKDGIGCEKQRDYLLLGLAVLDGVCFLTFIISLIVGIVQHTTNHQLPKN